MGRMDGIDVEIDGVFKGKRMNRSKIVSMAFVALLIAGGLTTKSYAQANPQDLLDAAGNGNVQMVNMLLGLNADPNVADSLGNTAVMYAAQFGHAEVIGVLADAGADINIVKPDGWSALLLACYVGQPGSVTELAARGADMTIKLDVLTPLMLAAHQGHAEVVTALLEAGVPVDETLSDGQTALFVATQAGNTDVVSALLAGGADPNHQTNNGAIAANSAITNNDTATIRVMAEADAIFTAGLEEAPGNASCPDPEYPDSLYEVEIEGQLVIEFLVDREGQTEDESVTIISSPHEGLNEAATQMFRECVYSRGLIAGIPVRVRLRQALNFGG